MSVPVSKFCNSNKTPAVKKLKNMVPRKTVRKYIPMTRQKETYSVSKEYLKLVERI